MADEKGNMLVNSMDNEFSKQVDEILASNNAYVAYIQSERLCGEILVKLLTIHGYKKTSRKLAKLGRKLNKLNRGIGIAND